MDITSAKSGLGTYIISSKLKCLELSHCLSEVVLMPD